jgi:hypothetical protein
VNTSTRCARGIMTTSSPGVITTLTCQRPLRLGDQWRAEKVGEKLRLLDKVGKSLRLPSRMPA